MKKERDEILHSNLEPRTSNFHWPRLYAGVLIFLALEILLFTLFTKTFQ